MSVDDIAALSLTEVAAKIAARELSSVEVTQACLDRIARYGDALNCIAGVEPEAALKEAEKADRELAAGRSRGPLHGVPLGHKDMYYRKGRVCACGSRINKDYVPEVTATALSRLDAAGALDIARLNMVEFALGPTGHNEITGPVCNPWDKTCITGGSSSGSGAAVAARLLYGALGSDTGGSIRVPASCCNLVGIKATYGRVSRYGAMPLSFTHDHVGPLTRTVADAALLLQALAGHDPMDPTTSDRPVPDYRAGLEDGVRGLRIAVPENYFYDKVDPAVETLLRESLGIFRALGAEIVPVTIPSIELANPAGMVISQAESASFHSRWLHERPQDYGTQTRSRLMAGLLVPAARYIEALDLRAKVLADFAAAVFSRADLLHLPVVAAPLPTIAESDIANNAGFIEYLTQFTQYTRPFNYLGLPAISVPAGFTSNGRPTGQQLVGRPFDEATLFRAARAYERETEWNRMAPDLDAMEAA